MSEPAARRFVLRVDEVLQGDFALGALNLLVVFQVNCPGCFLHALPMAGRIHEAFAARGLVTLGLSTAFEDFQENSLENTRRLLRDGALVGATAAWFAERGVTKREFEIPFPVAFDHLTEWPGPDGPVRCGATFARNGLEGTPTWLLLDADASILFRRFGHPSEPDLVQWLEQRLPA